MNEKKILIEIITEQVLNELDKKASLFKTCSYLVPPDKHVSITKFTPTLYLEDKHLQSLVKLSKIFTCSIDSLVTMFLTKILDTVVVKNKVVIPGGLDKHTIKISDELTKAKMLLIKEAFLKGEGIKKKPLDKKIEKLLSNK